MKSTAEALMKTPHGWQDPEPATTNDTTMKNSDMKEAETVSTSTPSTLSTQEFDINKMTQDELENFMRQAAEHLKNATPTKGSVDK